MAAVPTTPAEDRVWICECGKCGAVVEVSDAELSRRPPWPCVRCGESSLLIQPKRGDVATTRT
jgi:hypothetical protein